MLTHLWKQKIIFELIQSIKIASLVIIIVYFDILYRITIDIHIIIWHERYLNILGDRA